MWTITPTTTTKTNHFRHQHHPLEASRVCAKGTEHWDIACEKIGCWLGVFWWERSRGCWSDWGIPAMEAFSGRNVRVIKFCVFLHAALMLGSRLSNMPWPFLPQQLFNLIWPETNHQLMAGELTSQLYLSKVPCLKLLLFLLLWRYCFGRWVHATAFWNRVMFKWSIHNFQSNLWKFSNPESSKFQSISLSSAYLYNIYLYQNGQAWRIPKKFSWWMGGIIPRLPGGFQHNLSNPFPPKKSKNQPNTLPIGRDPESFTSMDHPKQTQPLCWVDWTSRASWKKTRWFSRASFQPLFQPSNTMPRAQAGTWHKLGWWLFRNQGFHQVTLGDHRRFS